MKVQIILPFSADMEYVVTKIMKKAVELYKLGA